MTCESALQYAASDGLTPMQRRDLESHAAACPACAAEIAEFRKLSEELRAMREESASDAVYSAIRARVIGEVESRNRRRWFVAWPAVVAGVTCAVLLMVGLGRSDRIADGPVASLTLPGKPLELASELPPAPMRRTIPKHARPTALEPQPSGDPLVVKMFTDDPEVVIYWIADAKNSKPKKESIP